MFQDMNQNAENFSFEKTEFKKESFINKQDMGCCEQVCPSVCEEPREKVCHRYFCYNVPHIIPCNTKIINHHVYKHSYIPQYTCCEENECCNVFEKYPNNFF